MNETLEFLYSLRQQGSKFGLQRMWSLVGRLNNPQHAFPCIHVAGTNGKGSVCAMLESIYRAHGFSVGLFTSPHLVELGERIRVNGQLLSFPEIEAWVDDLLLVCRNIEAETPWLHPTFFELMTAVAFLEFKKKGVDLAIIETGLGGRIDSTNVIDPMVSVITTVGFDHCDILGDTLSLIAREKAGIIKDKRPVITGWLEREAREEIARIALEKNSPFYCLGDQIDLPLPSTNLRGPFQRHNAALAQQTTQILSNRFPVNSEKTQAALLEVDLLGRWQLISEKPKIIVDACHNELGATASLELWSSLPSNTTVWFAACGTERAQDVLSLLFKHFKNYVFFELNQPRACSFSQMLSVFNSPNVEVESARETDLIRYYQNLPTHSTVLVTGSIYLVASTLSSLQNFSDSAPVVSKNWQDHW